MGIKSQRDFVAGLMFLGVGTAFAIGATSYSIGSGARMGPGYFPMVLGIVLAVLGGVITLMSFVKGQPNGDKIGKWAWKPLFFILLANFVFGICLGGLPSVGLPPLGLIVGIYGLVFIASTAGHEFSWKSVLVLATVLAIGSYLVFIRGLNLQMPVWPAFMTALDMPLLPSLMAVVQA